MARSKAFPKRDEWKAPWEKTGAKFDEDIAKTLIYNLQRDAHRAAGDESDEILELREELEEAQTELATTKQKAEADALAALPDNEKLIALIERAIAGKPAETPAPKGKSKSKSSDDGEELSPAELRALKLEIGMDKGLSKNDSLRLVGKDEDELNEDADKFLADHPKPGSESDEGDEGEDDGDEGDDGDGEDATPTTPQNRPRENFQPPIGGRKNGRGGDSNDPSKLFENLYPAGRN